VGPANTCETVSDHLNAAHRNAHSNFAGQRAILLGSLASRFALLRSGWRGKPLSLCGMEEVR
jgi:hypothetical protein